MSCSYPLGLFHPPKVIDGTRSFSTSSTPRTNEGRAVRPGLSLSADCRYSSSIWLYIRWTEEEAAAEVFCIGVLNLVARMAMTDRLDDKREITSKRPSMERLIGENTTPVPPRPPSADFERCPRKMKIRVAVATAPVSRIQPDKPPFPSRHTWHQWGKNQAESSSASRFGT